jgi:hypothetical protein
MTFFKFEEMLASVYDFFQNFKKCSRAFFGEHFANPPSIYNYFLLLDCLAEFVLTFATFLFQKYNNCFKIFKQE